jgi:hypothetical protein
MIQQKTRTIIKSSISRTAGKMANAIADKSTILKIQKAGRCLNNMHNPEFEAVSRDPVSPLGF